MDKRRQRPGGQPPPPPPPAAGADVGSRLRALFQAVEAAPVPDDISRLVVELERTRTRRLPRAH